MQGTPPGLTTYIPVKGLYKAQISALRRIGFRPRERPSTFRLALGRGDLEITMPFAGVLSSARIER